MRVVNPEMGETIMCEGTDVLIANQGIAFGSCVVAIAHNDEVEPPYRVSHFAAGEIVDGIRGLLSWGQTVSITGADPVEDISVSDAHTLFRPVRNKREAALLYRQRDQQVGNR